MHNLHSLTLLNLFKPRTCSRLCYCVLRILCALPLVRAEQVQAQDNTAVATYVHYCTVLHPRMVAHRVKIGANKDQNKLALREITSAICYRMPEKYRTHTRKRPRKVHERKAEVFSPLQCY
jgi:hypothetical protein